MRKEGFLEKVENEMKRGLRRLYSGRKIFFLSPFCTSLVSNSLSSSWVSKELIYAVVPKISPSFSLHSFLFISSYAPFSSTYSMRSIFFLLVQTRGFFSFFSLFFGSFQDITSSFTVITPTLISSSLSISDLLIRSILKNYIE